MAVPLKVLVCGLFDALSFTVKTPVKVPLAVGTNMTKTVQLAPADNDAPHWLKSLNGPVIVTLLIDTAVVPLFFTVKDCQAVPVFAGMVPKLKLAGVSVTVPAPPPAAVTVREIAVV